MQHFEQASTVLGKQENLPVFLQCPMVKAHDEYFFRKNACFKIPHFLFSTNNQLPMKLMLYLENDLIEAVALNTEKISQPGYLGAIKRQLKTRYLEVIQRSATPHYKAM